MKIANGTKDRIGLKEEPGTDVSTFKGSCWGTSSFERKGFFRSLSFPEVFKSGRRRRFNLRVREVNRAVWWKILTWVIMEDRWENVPIYIYGENKVTLICIFSHSFFNATNVSSLQKF